MSDVSVTKEMSSERENAATASVLGPTRSAIWDLVSEAGSTMNGAPHVLQNAELGSSAVRSSVSLVLPWTNPKMAAQEINPLTCGCATVDPVSGHSSGTLDLGLSALRIVMKVRRDGM